MALTIVGLAVALVFAPAIADSPGDPKRVAFEVVDRNADQIATVGDVLYCYAEPGMQEFESAKFVKETLESAGFNVELGGEDIDPTNMKEVLWAMMTRVDPPTNIDIVEGAWSTPLDPRMPPDKRDSKDHTNGRAIFYAVRPFAWKDKFPKVSRSSRELREKVMAKFRHAIPFPGS